VHFVKDKVKKNAILEQKDTTSNPPGKGKKIKEGIYVLLLLLVGGCCD
jgi:hypothetical protein